MEAAGLAIGVVGLVSLFSNCLDVLDKFEAYRDFGTDLHYVATQFEAEKLRFEKWGHAVGVLWINGPAGFGKTILCARIVEHISADIGTPVAHFFFSSDFESRSDPYIAIRSWISQVMSHPKAYEVVCDECDAQDGQSATRAHLVQMFRNIVCAMPECTFVLDGLDECTWVRDDQKFDSDAVTQFLKALRQAVADTHTRILIVSRDEAEIRQGLISNRSDDVFEYKVSTEDVHSDAVSYSRSIVNEKLFKKLETIKRDIAQRMVNRCSGQFLWLKLQEDSLDSWMTKRQLETAVEETPAGLEQTYERYWRRMSNFPEWKRSRAFSLLRWTAFALRPLTVCEISEALLINDDCDDLPIEEMPDSIDEDYINRGILGLCGSLLEVRSTSSESHVGARTVHLTHFSVRQYLVSNMSAPGSSIVANERVWSFNEAFQNSQLGRLCLRYVNFRKVWEDTLQKDEN
ncbi:ankyrin-1, partial [Pseudomassariella vexata]